MVNIREDSYHNVDDDCRSVSTQDGPRRVLKNPSSEPGQKGRRSEMAKNCLARCKARESAWSELAKDRLATASGGVLERYVGAVRFRAGEERLARSSAVVLNGLPPAVLGQMGLFQQAPRNPSTVRS